MNCRYSLAALAVSTIGLAGCAAADDAPDPSDNAAVSGSHPHPHPNPPTSSNPPVVTDAGVAVGPTDLRGYVGGKDIALIWEGMKTATKYTVYRDGAVIGTALPRPPGTRFSSNATFIDSNVVLGTTYAYQVEAVLADGAVSGRTAIMSVTHASKGTGIPEIVLDASVAPELEGYLEIAKTYLETWYPKIGDALASPNYTPTKRFTIKIDLPPCGAGVTSGTTIGICRDFAKSNPNDLSIFAHESTHVLQQYQGPGYEPTMIVEGIASWGGDFGTGYVQPLPPHDHIYTEGYGTAEYLFNWVAKTYDKPDFVRDINLAGHAGTFDYRMFVDQTGKTLGQLWTAMSGQKVSSPGRLLGPAAKCGDLSGANTTDGTPIGLLTCRTSDSFTWAQEIVAVAGDSDPSTSKLRLAGKCLAVDADSGVVIESCNAGDTSQSWKVQDGTILNVAQNKCVQPDGGRTSDGTPLVLAKCNGSASQKWTAPIAGQ